MKQFVLVVFTLLSVFGSAQTTDSLGMPALNGKVGIQKIVVDSMPMRGNAKKWVAEAFRSAQNVIQLDTDETLLVKGMTRIYHKGMLGTDVHDLYFTLKMEFKQGKTRLTLTDVTIGDYRLSVETYWKSELYKKLRVTVGNGLKEVISSLETALVKKEDW
jgi:Domain of unknown function (DUF4468) with TBP-like fold